MEGKRDLYVVIMAGGSGTRFWPLSRANRPKQFLPIVGSEPMVRLTYKRARNLASDDRIVLVVGKQHQDETQRIFADSSVRILVEPFGRNTAPCIGLAAYYVACLGGDSPVIVLPADHYVARPDILCRDLKTAVEVARSDAISTIGIVPTRPETGYGYIERESERDSERTVYRVRRFVEKPDLEKARRFIESGRFYWNAGIFVASSKVFLDEIRTHMPEFYKGLTELPDDFNSFEFLKALENLYRNTESISFDYAVMENPDHSVFVVPSDCGWSDVGSWYSLFELRRNTSTDDSNNVVVGDCFPIDTRECFLFGNKERVIVTLGLERILVVDTPDVVFVADLERSQDVRKVTSLLAESKRRELL